MLWWSLTVLAHPLDAAVSKLDRAQCTAPRTSSARIHPGAEQVYAGQLRFVDDTVAGEERRYLYANPAWKALGGERHGEDCVDVWRVTGRRVPAVDCPTCTHAFTFEGHLNVDASTCRRRLTPNGNHFKTTYQVTVDGTAATVRFASGKVLGTGTLVEGLLTWTSEQTCTWF